MVANSPPARTSASISDAPAIRAAATTRSRLARGPGSPDAPSSVEAQSSASRRRSLADQSIVLAMARD
jgi:hypothetical protein